MPQYEACGWGRIRTIGFVLSSPAVAICWGCSLLGKRATAFERRDGVCFLGVTTIGAPPCEGTSTRRRNHGDLPAKLAPSSPESRLRKLPLPDQAWKTTSSTTPQSSRITRRQPCFPYSQTSPRGTYVWHPLPHPIDPLLPRLSQQPNPANHAPSPSRTPSGTPPRALSLIHI